MYITAFTFLDVGSPARPVFGLTISCQVGDNRRVISFEAVVANEGSLIQT